MKAFISKSLPPSLLDSLQRGILKFRLLKPYKKLPFALSEIPNPDFKSTYARVSEKNSRASKKIMEKLNSFVGSGPIGPNKYWEYPWVLSNLDIAPGLSVLDAGCGRSPIQYMLADMGMRVSGTDPFENVGWHGIDRRLAIKFSLDIDYRVEGMEKISYPDETFDRVISVSVLEHCRATPAADELKTAQTVEDRKLQATMMGELARVLKKEGLLIITLDIVFPKNGAILECNVDVRNLVEGSGLTLNHPPETGYYGEAEFDMEKLPETADLDIQNYTGVLGTSLGLVFKKSST